MSSINQRLYNPAGQVTTDYDLSKLFIWNNRFESDSYLNNSGYNPLTLKAGTIMGRVASSNTLAPCISGALDGSQYPIGVLAQDVYSLAQGASQKVSICINGDVNSYLLIFLGGDSLTTVINGRTMQDWLQSYGLLIRTSTEMTDFDN